MSVYPALSDKGASLAEIIAAADATNHAIPTPNELSQAFTKLVNSGVLVAKGNNYEINIKYSSSIENAHKAKGGLFESANKGKKWLNSSGLSPIDTPKITVTEDQVARAYNEYTLRIRNKG
jgi:hypothetical protein